jgi:hypothetical protein
MKKYILGVFAVALAIGFSSFGTTSKVTKNRVFYAVKNGASFTWTQTQPSLDEFECVSASPYCQIEVADNFTPIDGQVPAAQDLINHSTSNSQYELIP